MRNHGRSVILLLALAGACQSRVAPGAEVLNRAVALASEAAAEQLGSEEYRLIGAEWVIHQRVWIWRITYKPERLLPANPAEEIGAMGGELFVNVNLATGDCTIRYGE
jgi:hypothetical protein